MNTKEIMFPLVAKWKTGQETIESICKSRKIKLRSFEYWRRMYNKEQMPVKQGFIPIEVENKQKEECISPKNIVELEIQGGIFLRIYNH
jgi:hypothetical protein